MKFRGTHLSLPVSSSFGGTVYSVSPGETVEIPDCWVSRVKKRGLMLEEVKETAAEPARTAVSSDLPTEPATKIEIAVTGDPETIAKAVAASTTPARRVPGRPPRNATAD